MSKVLRDDDGMDTMDRISESGFQDRPAGNNGEGDVLHLGGGPQVRDSSSDGSGTLRKIGPSSHGSRNDAAGARHESDAGGESSLSSLNDSLRGLLQGQYDGSNSSKAGLRASGVMHAG